MPADTDALVRNPLGYVLAADMIDLGQVSPSVDASFRSWITSWLPAVRSQHDSRPNNQGLFAGATRVAADIYIGDSADEALAWGVFRRWLGEDQSPYQEMQWGGPEGFFAWQAEGFPFFRGINLEGMQAPDCTGILRNVDGVLPDDQRRGDCNGCGWNCNSPHDPGCPPAFNSCKFRWPPVKTNYAYTGLQGALVQAVLHYRRGRDPWTIPLNAMGAPTNALKRAYVWLRDEAAHSVNDPLNGGCDLWPAYIANRLYGGLGLYEHFAATGAAAEPGFQVGYSDWTTQCATWP